MTIKHLHIAPIQLGRLSQVDCKWYALNSINDTYTFGEHTRA